MHEKGRNDSIPLKPSNPRHYSVVGLEFFSFHGYLKVKSFEYIVRCSFMFGSDAESILEYKGAVIYPGKEQKSKLTDSSVTGFSNATAVEITVVSVTFDDGKTYRIPASDWEAYTFDMR